MTSPATKARLMRDIEFQPEDFPPDHWSKDWNLFHRLKFEWDVIGKKYGVARGAQIETIDNMFREIFSPDEHGNYRHPAIREFYYRLASDPIFQGSVVKNLPPDKSRGLRFMNFYPITVLYCVLQVLRSAREWEKEDAVSTHWARFWSKTYFAKSVERSICYYLKSQTDQVSSLTGAFGAESDPMNTPRDYAGKSSPRPDQIAISLEEGLKDFPEFEQRVIREWMLKSGEGDDETEEEIARSFGLTLDQLNQILQSYFQKPRKKRR